MNPRQKAARDYCRQIKANPDELVWGYWPGTNGFMIWTGMPRWCWYQ